MTKKFNRWPVITASTAILLCTGAIYAFSVLAGPLSKQTGWTMPQIMLAFTINNAIGPIPMILGGYLVDKGYVKWTISLGALLFATGFCLSGFATSPGMLYLTYGLMAGLGQGFAYSGALSNTLRLFPDKRGLASGILTAGMGFAAVTVISMFFLGAFSGLMIASQAATIGQSMFGLSAGTAALYVSLYSISNSSGRFIWGTVSDKLGRSKTLTIIYSVVALALLVLTIIPGQLGFAIGIIGLGICFGGVMGVFPSIVMENYGPVNQGTNYGIVFTGYSLAAFFAPRVAVQMASSNQGNYSSAFYVAIVLALIGLAINLVYAKLSKKNA